MYSDNSRPCMRASKLNQPFGMCWQRCVRVSTGRRARSSRDWLDLSRITLPGDSISDTLQHTRDGSSALGTPISRRPPDRKNCTAKDRSTETHRTLQRRPRLQSLEIGVDRGITIVDDAEHAAGDQRKSHHDVGGRERIAKQVLFVAQLVFELLKTGGSARSCVGDQAGMVRRILTVEREPDDDAEGRERGALCEVEPLQEPWTQR